MQISLRFINDFFFFFVLVFFWGVAVVYPQSLMVGKALIIFALISNIQQIVRFRQQDYLVVFLIFSLLYWFFMIPFYFYGIPYHYLLAYQTIEKTNTVILLQLLLLRIMFLGVNPHKLTPARFMIRAKNNNIIFLGTIVLLGVFAGLIVRTIPISVFSGEYGLETKSSSLLEYALIPLMGAFLYANTRKKRFVVFFIACIFLLLPLLYGKRLAFLMIALLVFNFFFAGRFKLKTITIAVISLYIALRFFALLRIGLGDEMDWLFLWFGITDQGVMSNNQGGVMVCSVTYLSLIEQEIFDWGFRLKSLLGTFTGIFVPSSMNFEETYINLYTMKYAANIPGNGGFTSTYLYLWGGGFAVTLAGWIFNRLLRNPNHSRLVAIYFIFLMATFPRWYSYNMFILIKMGFWLLLFVMIVDTFDKYLRKI